MSDTEYSVTCLETHYESDKHYRICYVSDSSWGLKYVPCAEELGTKLLFLYHRGSLPSFAYPCFSDIQNIPHRVVLTESGPLENATGQTACTH